MMDCNVQVLIHASFARFKMKSLHEYKPLCLHDPHFRAAGCYS